MYLLCPRLRPCANAIAISHHPHPAPWKLKDEIRDLIRRRSSSGHFTSSDRQDREIGSRRRPCGGRGGIERFFARPRRRLISKLKCGISQQPLFSLSVSGDVIDGGPLALLGDGRPRAGRRPPPPPSRGSGRSVDAPPEDAAEDRAAGAAEPARLLEQHHRLLEGVRRPGHGAQVRGQGGVGAGTDTRMTSKDDCSKGGCVNLILPFTLRPISL